MLKGTRFIKILMLSLLSTAIGATEMFAQNGCLTQSEAENVIRSISNPIKPKHSKRIKRELLRMQKTQTAVNEQIFRSPKNKGAFLIAKLEKTREKNILRLCEIFKQYGWLDKKAIGNNGLEAVLYFIRNTTQTQVQRDLFPVITEATRKGLIPKANLAALIDKIRIKSGNRQIFGTQIKIRDEVGYLYPIENEAVVDKWRELYDLPPISNFIKIIETQYKTIVVKMPQPPRLLSKNKKSTGDLKDDDKKLLGLEENEDDVLNIESSLVNLNVRVLTEDLIGTRGLDLKKEDFLVYENGKLQDISFFSTTDTPFDLVLLLDLSGSTIQKQQLIAESASRFIELARPEDRIAIVTFSDYPSIISEWTSDKKKLLSKVKKINDYGSSKVWDALDYTYKNILQSEKDGKRSAIVFMTDGVDNTLVQNPLRPSSGSLYYSSRPSKITFTELLDTVRKNDANIFSIYLDTENRYSGRFSNEKSYRQGRRTLKMLAEESGGQFYRAGKIEDLSGIYERIINDLSEVYSLGYEPKENKNQSNWRELEVKIKNRSDLIVKSKRGYYAK